MATYPAERIIRGSLEFQLAAGQSAFIVCHFARIVSGSPVELNVTSVAEAMESLATDTFSTFALAGVMSNQVQIVAAHARTIDPLVPLAADIPIGISGSQPSESVPFETAYVVTHYTSLASRRGRGRNFVPGLAVVEIDNGAFLAAGRAAQNTVWTEWRESIATNWEDIEFVVYSPTNGSGVTVDNSIVRSTFHHQRSRNPR